MLHCVPRFSTRPHKAIRQKQTTTGKDPCAKRAPCKLQAYALAQACTAHSLCQKAHADQGTLLLSAHQDPAVHMHTPSHRYASRHDQTLVEPLWDLAIGFVCRVRQHLLSTTAPAPTTPATMPMVLAPSPPPPFPPSPATGVVLASALAPGMSARPDSCAAFGPGATSELVGKAVSLVIAGAAFLSCALEG